MRRRGESVGGGGAGAGGGGSAGTRRGGGGGRGGGLPVFGIVFVATPRCAHEELRLVVQLARRRQVVGALVLADGLLHLGLVAHLQPALLGQQEVFPPRLEVGLRVVHGAGAGVVVVPTTSAVSSGLPPSPLDLAPQVAVLGQHELHTHIHTHIQGDMHVYRVVFSRRTVSNASAHKMSEE